MAQDGFNISLSKWQGNAEYEITFGNLNGLAEIGGLEVGAGIEEKLNISEELAIWGKKKRRKKNTIG